MHYCLCKEVIEAPTIATLVIDRKRSISFRATYRNVGAPCSIENACAKWRIVGVDCSGEMHPTGNGQSLARNDSAAQLRKCRSAALSNVGH